jgi:hypothetical protein
LPKWRKATWAIAIWTAIFALVMVPLIVGLITQPQENQRLAGVALSLPVQWTIGMLVLGSIWLLSRPKAAASLDPQVIEQLDQLMALRDEGAISPEEHKRRVEEALGGGRSSQ